ncbi:MAG: hypothetical protein ABEJ57_06015 [Halobacteriaceae archaeon]
MSTIVSRSSTSGVPAYGPIDAALGFVVFFLFLERATPHVVDVLTDVAGLHASVVRLGLAAFLWFIFLVTFLDQLNRQYLAVQVVPPPGDRSVRRPARSWVVIRVGAVIVGGAIAVWTFDAAVETGITFFEMLVRLDLSLFDVGALMGLVGFFIAFGIASWALDRLVIRGLRIVVASGRE